MRAFWVLGLGLLLIGCSLGLDEDQIASASGAGGAPPGTTTAGTGQPTTSSPASAGSSTSGMGNATAASSSASSSTVASSSSTGAGGAVVACLSGDSVVMCQPGEVCCVTNYNAAACSAAPCTGDQLSWACDGPEDCPGGVCCAPQEEDGNLACDVSCIDDETVCKSESDCDDLCIEHFPGSLSDQYSTCG